jgi:hypothetical protein
MPSQYREINTRSSSNHSAPILLGTSAAGDTICGVRDVSKGIALTEPGALMRFDFNDQLGDVILDSSSGVAYEVRMALNSPNQCE